MTAFEDAARAEAERRHETGEMYRLEAVSRLVTFTDGAEWARRYEAEREASDAEVEAAREAMVRVFGWKHLQRYSRKPEGWLDSVLNAMARAALTAFRKAGMEEEG